MERDCLRVQPRPHTKGAGPQCSQILGFPSIYTYILWRSITKFDVVTHMGRSEFLGVSLSHSQTPSGRGPRAPQFGGSPLSMTTPFNAEAHASHPKRAEFQRSPILWVLLYLCLHPLTQNEQIRHGNTWSGLIFRRSVRSSIPRQRGPSGLQFCGFSATYVYTVWPRTIKLDVVTHMGRGEFLLG